MMRVLALILASLLLCVATADPAQALPQQTRADIRDVVQAQPTWTTSQQTMQRTPRTRCDESWCRPECGWVLSLPVWVPGVSGSLAVGDAEFTPGSGSSSDDVGRVPDVATALEFAFVGAVTHYRGPWSFGVDAFGLRIGNEIRFKFRGAKIESELRAGIGRLWASYRFSQHTLRLWDRTRPAVAEHEVYAGARISWVSFKADLPGGGRRSAERNWIDPIIGLRSRLHLRNGWSILVQGDVGGFGVSSEFAWSFLAGLTYRVSQKFSVTLAWSTLDMDYRRTLKGVAFDFDLQLSGPHLGMSFYL